MKIRLSQLFSEALVSLVTENTHTKKLQKLLKCQVINAWED
jgi:hypothetical protein